MLPIVIAIALAADSARIVGNRVIVEPAGSSITIPAAWLDTAKHPIGDCLVNQPANFHAPLSPSRREIAGARTPWHREYSAVADSVLGLGEAVAHIGRISWQTPPCYADLQVRLYVSELSVDQIAARVRTIGVATASRFFPASARIAEGAGTRRVRISWTATYVDYGGLVFMDYHLRPLKGRTEVLLLMYTRHSASSAADDAAAILASWRQVR